MRITSKSIRHGDGFALTITMIFLAVALVIFGSIMYWISSNAKVTERNNQYNMSSGAAEAAVERVLSQMDRDFLSQSLTSQTYYASLLVSQTGWPIQYNYSDPIGGTTNAVYVLLGAPSTNTVALNSQFAGLYGLAQACTISAKATPINVSGASVYNVPATVTETVNFANIPLFQFAIFYNINLEIAPGQTMTITGPVFSNKGIWAGASDTTFSSSVTAVGSAVNTTANDPFALNYSKDGGPTFTQSGQPTVQDDPLTMPIGTNNNPAVIASLLGLPPAAFALGTTAAYSTNGQVYLANGADLFITNSAFGTNSTTPSGTNTIVYYQDGFAASHLAPIKPDYYILKNPLNFTTNFVFTNMISGGAIGTATNYAGNVRFAGYSFITNTLFYDWREGWSTNSGVTKGKPVQAVQIDIAKFATWLTNAMTNASGTANGGAYLDQTKVTDSGHHIDSMYVYTSVPLTATNLPAVRVVNGALLPSVSGSRNGFTVATQFPMYVWGNYNSKDASGSALGLSGNLAATAHTYPAALMADAITILSTNWSDATTSKMPNSGNTTVNAAMLEGIVETDNTISGDYSGGVENFMRLLEDWTQNPSGANSQQTLTYNGSIVVMFPSQYATHHWQPTGDYYNAPSRNWSFDQNFTTASKLPPLTPQTKALIRGNWMAQ